MVVNNGIPDGFPSDIYNEFIQQNIHTKITSLIEEQLNNVISTYSNTSKLDYKIYHNPNQVYIYITGYEDSEKEILRTTSLTFIFLVKSPSQGTSKTFKAVSSSFPTTPSQYITSDSKNIKLKLNEVIGGNIFNSIVQQFVSFFSMYTTYSSFDLTYSDGSLSLSLLDAQENTIATINLGITYTLSKNDLNCIRPSKTSRTTLGGSDR